MKYQRMNQQTSSVNDISSSLATAMDAIPEMTEMKRKIDMHVQIASKILYDIKRRSLDKLQDYEDEIMNSNAPSAAVKADILVYLKGETASDEELIDKIRILTILV